jgi:DNA-binding MarR family transcriptional regulator
MRQAVKRNYTKIPNQVIRNPDLLPVEKLILIYILTFEECFAGLENFGNVLGFSRSTIQRSMAKLIKRGLVIKIRSNQRGFRYSADLSGLVST